MVEPSKSAGNRSGVNCTRVKLQPQSGGERSRDQRLAQPGQILDEHMAAREDGGEDERQRGPLADHDTFDFVEHRLAVGGGRSVVAGIVILAPIVAEFLRAPPARPGLAAAGSGDVIRIDPGPQLLRRTASGRWRRNAAGSLARRWPVAISNRRASIGRRCRSQSDRVESDQWINVSVRDSQRRNNLRGVLRHPTPLAGSASGPTNSANTKQHPRHHGTRNPTAPTGDRAAISASSSAADARGKHPEPQAFHATLAQFGEDQLKHAYRDLAMCSFITCGLNRASANNFTSWAALSACSAWCSTARASTSVGGVAILRGGVGKMRERAFHRRIARDDRLARLAAEVPDLGQPAFGCAHQRFRPPRGAGGSEDRRRGRPRWPHAGRAAPRCHCPGRASAGRISAASRNPTRSRSCRADSAAAVAGRCSSTARGRIRCRGPADCTVRREEL